MLYDDERKFSAKDVSTVLEDLFLTTSLVPQEMQSDHGGHFEAEVFKYDTHISIT